MVRSRHSFFFFILLFAGLYALTHDSFFGHWYSLGDASWTKWLFLGLGIWIVCALTSSRPGRVYRRNREFGLGGNYRDQSAIYTKLDQLQEELAELRRHRSEQSTKAESSKVDRKLDELTERIINLEKIVTDRQYELNEKINKL